MRQIWCYNNKKKEKNDEINKIINGNPFINMENDFYQEMDSKIKKYINYNKEFLKYLYMMEDIKYKFVDDEINLDELADTFNMLIKNINQDDKDLIKLVVALSKKIL